MGTVLKQVLPFQTHGRKRSPKLRAPNARFHDKGQLVHFPLCRVCLARVVTHSGLDRQILLQWKTGHALGSQAWGPPGTSGKPCRAKMSEVAPTGDTDFSGVLSPSALQGSGAGDAARL